MTSLQTRRCELISRVNRLDSFFFSSPPPNISFPMMTQIKVTPQVLTEPNPLSLKASRPPGGPQKSPSISCRALCPSWLLVLSSCCLLWIFSHLLILVDLPRAHQLHVHWLAVRQEHWHSRASVCSELHMCIPPRRRPAVRITPGLHYLLCLWGVWMRLWREKKEKKRQLYNKVP